MTAAGPIAAAKHGIRDTVRTARALVDPEASRIAAERLADNVAALVADRDVACVAAYVSIGGEPGTAPLIERLCATGVPVMLPILRPDLDLDWAYHQPGQLRAGRFGLIEPGSPPLGIDGLQSADLIVCPGAAGSPDGDRLGRGGGSYDRALARSLPSCLRCLLLYDSELLAEVPAEPHDQRVDVIVTPSRTLWTSVGRR